MKNGIDMHISLTFIFNIFITRNSDHTVLHHDSWIDLLITILILCSALTRYIL